MNCAAQILKYLFQNPSSIRTTSQAKQLHAQAIKLRGRGIPFYEFTTLILSVYANFNLLRDAISVFHTYRSPPTKAWKSIIQCYAYNGHFEESLDFFNQMRVLGKNPGRNVFPSVLKTCVHLRSLKIGEAMHGCIVRLGLDSDLFTGNALMNMYAKLEPLCFDHALDDFSDTNRKYVFGNDVKNIKSSSKFSRASRLVAEGFDHNPIGRIFSDNQDFERRRIGVNKVVDMECNLQKQSNLTDVETKSIHSFKERDKGTHQSSVKKVFELMPNRDVVSWNTILGRHVQSGMYDEALAMMREMGNAELKPDSFTLSSLLPIFADFADVMRGKEIHGYVVRHGFDKDLVVGSSLVDMYANCSLVEYSCKIFHSSSQKDDVSWNSIISGCVMNGRFDKGLELFREMVMAKIKPVASTFSSILPTCAHTTTLSLGKQFHGYIIRSGFDDNIYVANSLLDMYSKCGHVRIAQWLFDKMEFHDVISWTAIIMSHAVHGNAGDAILLFEKMQTEGVTPNSGSFVAVLTACSHGGLVNEAWKYFETMTQNYSLTPCLEHYAAISDLLCRAGKLDEAYEFISRMHIAPTSSVLSSLLSACRIRKNVELAEKVAKKMFVIAPEEASAYVLLSDIYFSAGRWKDAKKVRSTMRKKGVIKVQASSWIEVKNKMHSFGSGERSHRNCERISL